MQVSYPYGRLIAGTNGQFESLLLVESRCSLDEGISGDEILKREPFAYSIFGESSGFLYRVGEKISLYTRFFNWLDARRSFNPNSITHCSSIGGRLDCHAIYFRDPGSVYYFLDQNHPNIFIPKVLAKHK